MGAKVLIYGAGPLGSLFAARLHQGGNDVSLLARGRRLADLQKHGTVVHDTLSHVETTDRVNLVERLAPEDTYDLVLVIMRKNNALDILPILAANTQTPNVLFLTNNAAGPGALVEALGASRVLIGFPNSAGYREGHVVHCLTGTEEDPARIPFGEIDGRVTHRTLYVARILQSAPGFGTEVRTDMDVWLKYHVALLMPSLAPALYMCGTDNYRMARTRDADVLAVRAIREGFRVLQALGYPITPKRLRPVMWMPEPMLVPFVQKLMADPKMETAMAKHAESARDEMKHLADEFLVLAAQTDVPIPSIRRLYPHFDPSTPLMPEASAEIPIDWRGLCLGLSVIAGLILGAIGTRMLLRGRESDR